MKAYYESAKANIMKSLTTADSQKTSIHVFSSLKLLESIIRCRKMNKA